MSGWPRRVGAGLAALAVLAFALPAYAAPGPSAAPEYWFDSWHLTSLFADGVRGQGVTIAEIDTGVNASLPELAGRVVAGTDLGVPGGNGQTDRDVEGFGHGTAMASIMVARAGVLDITGVAPDAKIMPIAVPLSGTTDQNAPDDLPQAIRYAAQHGAKIISMSLGGKRTPSSDAEPCPDDEQAAIYYALRKGAVVVAAVGNTGPRQNTVEEPGVCLGVVSVGAIDRQGTVAGFSTRQPYLTLVAPGVAVPSLGRVRGQAYAGKGTSQATAIVSAALALVWSKYPTLTGAQIVARVLATLDGRRANPSSSYGYGALNAYRAVTASVATDAPNPVSAAVAPFLARQDLLAADGLGAPPPAARPTPKLGLFKVGTQTKVNGRLLAGMGLTAGGLILLVSLLAVGLVGPPARRRVAAAQNPPETPPNSTPAVGPTEPAAPPD